MTTTNAFEVSLHPDQDWHNATGRFQQLYNGTAVVEMVGAPGNKMVRAALDVVAQMDRRFGGTNGYYGSGTWRAHLGRCYGNGTFTPVQRQSRVETASLTSRHIQPPTNTAPTKTPLRYCFAPGLWSHAPQDGYIWDGCNVLAACNPAL